MSIKQRPLAIFLMGPTASGKTDLALFLAKRFPFELISVDSAMVYRGMDIGTAKPDCVTLAKYPHHLVDILDPVEPYSAADFAEDALQLMAEISKKGKIPLLVGGTMLYYKVLFEGIATELPSADETIRTQILSDAAKLGWTALHQRLASFDPESAQRIHPNDPQRMQRALEVYLLTGKTLTQYHLEQQEAHEFPYRTLNLAIAPVERAVLHQRIADRFQQMLTLGFIDEVAALKQRDDLSKKLPSMRAVGYRQVWDYLDGELSYEEMIEKGVIATRQLAKRQFTWLRRWKNLTWLDSLATDAEYTALKIVEQELI
ncbi:tRNA (adenosine(37)-N6)-dimethylallyltransferase MiaA [Zooshikella harenae]|uniref:tRNA dimethylallyltransferase n=1 Tax=Zooshikella harenae TaxID=2827238 RepID=A0ABS5ZA12_9GAMM|nr:tRNA (adenosine(37)-N6)-dimethylallyltransferase MiaA [Zooshikella harenae]MBU2710897.1 tRNA (adenosine(37)-N6)-dimethylallyltransferase MiaA [Zooshikella harenae]